MKPLCDFIFVYFNINSSRIYVYDLAPVKCINYAPLVAFEGGESVVVVDLLFSVALIVCGSFVFDPGFVM